MHVIKPEVFDEHYQITMEFKLNTPLRREPFDEDFVHEISGRILASLDDEESAEEAGILSATLAQFDEAMEHGIDSERLGDGISGELGFYWEELFDVNTGDLKPEIRVEHETEGCNLLIFNFIQVHPKFRGHDIGLTAVQKTIEIFAHGCALVALTPEPLQFTSLFRDDPDKLKQLQAPNSPKPLAMRKLRQYWSKADFAPFGENGIYLKSPRLEAVESFRLRRLTEGDHPLLTP